MIIDGAGGYYDPADTPGLAGFTATLMREGTDDARRPSRFPSSSIGSRRRSASAPGISSPFATVVGQRPDRQPRHRARADGRRRDAPVVPAGRRSIATRRGRSAGLMNQRSQPGVSRAGALPARGVRRSSGGARVGDAGGARRADARRAGRVPQGALRAGSRRAGGRRRHHAGAGEAEGRGGVRRMGEGGRDDSGDARASRRSAAAERFRSSRGPARCRPACVVGTQSIERTDPGLRGADRGEPRARRARTRRLFEHLREQKGYTYGAGSAFSSRRATADPGAPRTDVRTEVTDPALTDLLDEIRQMRDMPVPAKELAEHRSAPSSPGSRDRSRARTRS